MALEVTPCLANSPSMTNTWQRPHSARPPHTESTSTPSVRAACRRGVPRANRPRLPEGVKTTAASLSLILDLYHAQGAETFSVAAVSACSSDSPAVAPLTAAACGAFG